MKTRILIVDDEPGIRQTLGGILEDEGFQVEAVENGEGCLDLLARSIFELVILDIWLPGIDGLETLNRIQRIPQADRPVAVMRARSAALTCRMAPGRSSGVASQCGRAGRSVRAGVTIVISAPLEGLLTKTTLRAGSYLGKSPV